VRWRGLAVGLRGAGAAGRRAASVCATTHRDSLGIRPRGKRNRCSTGCHSICTP
jgi:hypothetical protein